MVKLLTERIADVAITILIGVVAFLAARSFDMAKDLSMLRGEVNHMQSNIDFTRRIVVESIIRGGDADEILDRIDDAIERRTFADE